MAGFLNGVIGAPAVPLAVLMESTIELEHVIVHHQGVEDITVMGLCSSMSPVIISYVKQQQHLQQYQRHPRPQQLRQPI